MNKLQANTGWLEPLLARVAESASHVVTPVNHHHPTIILIIHVLAEKGLNLVFANIDCFFPRLST